MLTIFFRAKIRSDYERTAPDVREDKVVGKLGFWIRYMQRLFVIHYHYKVIIGTLVKPSNRVIEGLWGPDKNQVAWFQI